ncbi:hypothetical protein ACWGIV_03560 [Streptomyces sp. NPDC054844]
MSANVTGPLDKILEYIAWLVSAAAVCGLLIIGTRMAIALRSGQGEEHLVQFALVMAACIIGVCAGPVVDFLLPIESAEVPPQWEQP